MNFEENNKSDKECLEILEFIFKDSDALYKSVAPKGWNKSDSFHFFHPTVERQYEEHKRSRDMISHLKNLRGEKLEEPLYDDISAFAQNDSVDDIEAKKEFNYILGLTTYDIFSNNHSVMSKEGETYDLGSMRGSGRFIADFFNEKLKPDGETYDYMDFYMGTVWIDERANLLPFYEFIFSKLKLIECNWVYEFPRLYVINFDKSDGINNKPKNYNPTESVLNQIDKDASFDKLKNDLNQSAEADYEDAKYKPLISIVQAYKNVYDCLPKGHPQKEFE